MKKIAIYGAGFWGKKILTEYFNKDEVYYFIVSDFVDIESISEEGKFQNIPLIHYSEYIADNNINEYIVINSLSDIKEAIKIEDILNEAGIENIQWQRNLKTKRELEEIFLCIDGTNYVTGDIRLVKLFAELFKCNAVFESIDIKNNCKDKIIICREDFFEISSIINNTEVILLNGNRHIYFSDEDLFLNHIKSEQDRMSFGIDEEEAYKQSAYVKNAMEFGFKGFININVETVSACNGHCSFCPASRENDIRR